MNIIPDFSESHQDDPEKRFRLSLSQTQIDILEALEEKPGYVIAREKLLDMCNLSLETDERTIDTYIKRIREKAVNADLKYNPIRTRRGFGYIAKTVAFPAPSAEEKIYVDDSTYIDKRNYCLVNGDTEIKLTFAEYSLAENLFSNPLRIFTRGTLKTAFSTANEEVNDRVVDTHMKRLRQKLKQVGTPNSTIKISYGNGYYFDRQGLRA